MLRIALAATVLLLLIPAASEAKTLRGSAHADVIKGRGGNDRLVGRAGNDRLYGGRGADRYSCGPGRDTVQADLSDVRRGRIAADCEIVRGLPVTPASRWEPILPG